MTSPPPQASLPDDAAWHRLHPLSPLVRAGRQMVTIVVAVLLLFGILVILAQFSTVAPFIYTLF